MKVYDASFMIEVDDYDYPTEESIKKAIEAALDPVGIVIRVKVIHVPF